MLLCTKKKITSKPICAKAASFLSFKGNLEKFLVILFAILPKKILYVPNFFLILFTHSVHLLYS